MTQSRYINITAQYEPQLHRGRMLAWLAPELRDARLALIEDRSHDLPPSRTWAGTVDADTFERFAQAWRLPIDGRPADSRELGAEGDSATYVKTFDGMNWEIDGECPIICVSLRVSPGDREVDHRADASPVA